MPILKGDDMEKQLELVEQKSGELEIKLQTFAITSTEDNTKAASFQGWLKGAQKELEKERKFLVDPLNKHIKDINAKYKPLTEKLTTLHEVIGSKMLVWYNEQKRVSEETARKQQEAVDKEKQERREMGMGIADIADPVPQQTVESKTQTNWGTSYVRKSWTFKIVDPTKIPSKYYVLDEGIIRQEIRDGVREIPGIEIFQEETMATRT